MRHVLMALAILVISGIAAAGSNALREPSLPWIRKPLPPPVPTPAPAPTTTTAATQQAKDEPDKAGVVRIDAVLKHLTEGTATFIDAREAHEFDEGHFKVAIHLPSSAIYKNIEKVLSMVPTESKVIVYCGGGDCEASHNVSDALRGDFKYADVSIYEKGWEEVMKSGRFNDFIEKGAAP